MQKKNIKIILQINFYLLNMQYRRQTKDIKKRGLYIKTELIQRLIKMFRFIFKNNLFFFSIFNSVFGTIKYKNFRSHIKNFCIMTGRSKSIHKKFKVSRISLIELSNKGYFFGLKKASW
jgi:ribosomal protein S14